MKNSVHIINEGLDISLKDETSTLELLLKNDIEIDHSCGGMGSCGTCRVLVKSNLQDLPERNEVEQERASDLSFDENERLTCQLCPYAGLVIEIPKITAG